MTKLATAQTLSLLRLTPFLVVPLMGCTMQSGESHPHKWIFLYLESYLMLASEWDDKIGYCADFKSASLNAFLGGTLNGVHNAKWRESSTQWIFFIFYTPLMQASGV